MARAALEVLALRTGEVAVLVSVAAAVLAGIGLAFARRSALASEKAADAAEGSQEAAQRSADAAERSATSQSRSLEIEEERLARESIQEAEERSPRWEPASDAQPAAFTWFNGRFEGRLLNAGLSPAAIELAVLDTSDGQRHELRIRREPSSNLDGGWEGKPIISAGSLLAMAADVPSTSLTSSGRPRIYLDYSAVGVMRIGAFGVTIDLLRQPEDPRGAIPWKLGDVRYNVVP